jgi:5-methylcytosine-specific restriction protein A
MDGKGGVLRFEVCFYCRTVVTDKTVTQDHAIPLSRGGTNFASNLLPACRPCNSRKNSKTVFEYLGLK